MKKYISRIGILTLILMIGITLYICIGINVMDKICWFGLSGGLNRVPESEGIGLSRDISADFILETLGAVGVDYKEEYLRDSVGVSLCFYKEGEKMRTIINVYLSDTAQINLNMTYYCEEKTLIYEPVEVVKCSDKPEEIEHYKDKENINRYLDKYNITREDIAEYQRYGLYDVVVKTWVDANGGNYEWERMKLEKCTLDNTFLFKN